MALRALTGLTLPPLDLTAVSYGHSWRSANTLVFSDLMKHSTPFKAGARGASATGDCGWLGDENIQWRTDGYPAGLSPPYGWTHCANSTIGAGGAFYPSGKYVVLYDGEGVVEFAGDAAWPPLASSPGRLELNVTASSGGMRLRIVKSSFANPLVNIRIIPADLESTYNTPANTFRPEFLKQLEGVPLLRYANWMLAVGNSGSSRAAPRNWTRRTTPTTSTQSFREVDGVAVEHCVDLANVVGADMWVSLPRAADDNDAYAYNMLKYLATSLAPGRKLTLEYMTDGPGWIEQHLPNNTRRLARIAQRVFAEVGRPRTQLRVVQTAPGINFVANMLGVLDQQKQLDPTANYSDWLDAVALPASFGGQAYSSVGADRNPTAWQDGAYFLQPPSRQLQPQGVTLEAALKLIRSSVMVADLNYNRALQVLRARGLEVLGYAAGPELGAPQYGARANMDRILWDCGFSFTAWPCKVNNLYPPWSLDGSTSVTYDSAAARNASLFGFVLANATREADLLEVLRRALLHNLTYDLMLDSLWRWHYQMNGSDVVLDLTKQGSRCDYAPGIGALRKGFMSIAPTECQPGALTSAAGAQPLPGAFPTDAPAFRALKAWLAAEAGGSTGGLRGALPRAAAEASTPAFPPAASCKPACVYGTCTYYGVCSCWAGASGPDCSVLAPSSTPSACSPRLGVNLEGVADWSRSWFFVDAWKASRAWISQNFVDYTWSTGTAQELISRRDGPFGPAAYGYPARLAPNQKVSSIMTRDLEGHAPGGWYTVLYEGKGVIAFSLSDVKDVVYKEAGLIRVLFRPSTDFNNGMLLSIERTDPTDPIRNVRVLMPGFERQAEAGDLLHPLHLDFLRPFGLIRFMDWMNTNQATLPTSWDTRPRITDLSFAYSVGGVPLEVMTQLVNRLGSDPWFCMPHAATDDYVRGFAEAALRLLRPDVKVYVEYSNEVWGTGFPGGQYAQEMGLKMNLTEEGNRWYGGATNEARLCFVAHRTANISRIWKTVWGSAAGRVNVVVSGQAVWPITSSKLLSCGGAHKHIDALAIAPYFGSYSKTRDTNLETFVNSTLVSQINESLAYVAQHAAIAANFSKPLLCYESGQGLVGDGSTQDVALQANRAPGMYARYRQYLNGLIAKNVSRAAHFSSFGAFTRYGSWGLMEWQDQDRRDSYKLQGLLSVLNEQLQCPLPPPLDPASCPNACSDNGVCARNAAGQPVCYCNTGFAGEDCGQGQYTEVYKCGYYCTFGQGSCNTSVVTQRSTRTWTCACKPGISGLECSINSCSDNCNGHGECVDQNVCACYPGYSGDNCALDCGCNGHGRCTDTNSSSSSSTGGALTCICDVGWRLGPNGCEWDCSDCDDGTSCIGPGECGCAEDCVYGTCIHGACRCWAGYGGARCDLDEQAAAAAGLMAVPRLNRGSLAGVNVNGLSYWSTEWVWSDVMKGGGEWWTANKPDTAWENPYATGKTLELRPDGYPARLPPNTIAHKLILRNVALHAWPGRYVVLWDGEGRLDFGFDAKVASRDRNRMEVILTPTADLTCLERGDAYCGDNGIYLAIADTNPANPIHNIRILPSMGGAAASAGGAGAGGAWEGRHARTPFHPWFLKSLARYGVIRFMNWMGVTAGERAYQGAQDWEARRRKPDYHTQTGSDGAGAALEHIVQLCNMVGAAPWVNVPYSAGEDPATLRAIAALLRDQLRPDVSLYVEYSNEVWNTGFDSYKWARDRGLALKLSTDGQVAAYRYHARATTAIAEAFREVFATAPGGGSSRVKVVLGGWGFLCNGGTGCGAWHMADTLGWNGTAAKVDYYGVTGYWNCGLGGNGPADALLSVTDMLAKCRTQLAADEVTAAALAAKVATYGKSVITYEAGPSIVEQAAIEDRGETPAATVKYVAVNRHPDMYGLYRDYLDMYQRVGFVSAGRPYMQFTSVGRYGKYGSWGLQEYTGQPLATAPKYRAYMDWLDSQAIGPGPRAQCLSLAAAGGAAGGVSGTAGGGGMALAEGLLQGAPAVHLPATGSVWVQGQTATLQWATVGWPPGPSRPLTITLWSDADCADGSDQRQQKPADQALAVLARDAALNPPGRLDWTLPLRADGPAALAAAVAAAEAAAAAGGGRRRVPRFFIRISDGVSTNYSEPFDIRPPYTYATGAWGSCDCVAASPRQWRNVSCRVTRPPGGAGAAATLGDPVPVRLPHCDAFPSWNITRPDPVCSITATGCREYRTSNRGLWAWSNFKPAVDCTAQHSPWPAAAADASPVAAPDSVCAAAGAVAPPSSRNCSDASTTVTAQAASPAKPVTSIPAATGTTSQATQSTKSKPTITSTTVASPQAAQPTPQTSQSTKPVTSIPAATGTTSQATQSTKSKPTITSTTVASPQAAQPTPSTTFASPQAAQPTPQTSQSTKPVTAISAATGTTSQAAQSP
ncbi:hypothetical protein HYH02_002845 [Chlamydomonas schloesseri]|uniref:EGF-like domain-containing protein n=1 Tax=Chlamydomonas schloesseri TaxID=2026947 RepID=A0A835WR75_9CHLO|nr:hypothetical protein HYH02_002845 [Chlamydomonas schloesseri]|eukprot:KAG2452608.1 hypothetical protein HYH02_002845 [Chlamydomonas schloesseri]